MEELKLLLAIFREEDSFSMLCFFCVEKIFESRKNEFWAIIHSYESIGKEEFIEAQSTAKNHRFIAYENGIVHDTRTGLQWVVGPDKHMNWDEAKSWVAKLSLDGGDWRIPTTDELMSIYEPGLGKCNKTPLLKSTAWYIWANDPRKPSSCSVFRFTDGQHWKNSENLSHVFSVRHQR